MSTPAEALATSLVPSLVVHPDHGAAVLVSGVTRGARRAVLDATVARMSAAGTAPVVVRLGPRRPDGRLSDELSAVVEAALQRLHAPGGLYEDRGDGAHPSLAGWLFRARAVGRPGLVLVIDDLDGWLDARGAKKSLPDPCQQIVALLDETRRRALSLLASARAGEASGAPALPSDIVRRFATVHVLGAATTVTRDPGTLVAALGGRTFSLSGVRDATEGWLELPAPLPGHDPDDTLIVFSSPLAPPVLEVSVLAWDGAPNPDAGSDRVPPTGPTLAQPGEAVSAPRDVLADARRWPGALRTALAVRESVRRARDLTAMVDPATAERLFRETISPLPLALASLAEGEAAVGSTPTGIARAAAVALARYDQAFRRVYATAAEGWARGAPRPLMLSDLPERLSLHAARVGARATAFVLLTGLRLDLWQRFRDRVLSHVGGLTLAEEGIHWAALALDAEGRPGVLPGTSPGTSPGSQAESLAGSLADSLRPRREHLGSVEVIRVSAYAAALGVQGTPLEAAAETVEDALPAVLRAVCGGFAGRTAVLLASDAGSVGPSDVGQGTDMGGRRVGGDSAAAVVVPYALLTWG